MAAGLACRADAARIAIGEAGVVTFDAAYLASAIDGMIAGCRDDIRVWEELRGGAPADVRSAAEPAAPRRRRRMAQP